MRICVLTGGTAGIGYVALGQLLSEQTDLYVLVLRRTPSEQLTTLITKFPGRCQEIPCDLADLRSVKTAAQTIQNSHATIEVLICNAGLADAFMSKAPRKQVQGLERSFGVNHLAHFLLFLLLEDQLRAGRARVVLTASKLHTKANIDANQPVWMLDTTTTPVYTGGAAYALSKAQNILFAHEIHKRYADAGITAVSLHPGFIPATSFMRDQGTMAEALMRYVVQPIGRLAGFVQTIDHGANVIIQAVNHPTGGVYIGNGGVETPSVNLALAPRLWADSQALVQPYL